jgi:tripartite-type tricarboxylate transporter receptor subunit TctC
LRGIYTGPNVSAKDAQEIEDAIKKSVTKKNYDASLSSYGFEYRMVTGDELKQLVKKNVDDYRQLLLRYK